MARWGLEAFEVRILYQLGLDWLIDNFLFFFGRERIFLVLGGVETYRFIYHVSAAGRWQGLARSGRQRADAVMVRLFLGIPIIRAVERVFFTMFPAAAFFPRLMGDL